MTGQLLSVADTAALITSGHSLLLAGDESLLDQLPAGSWIAGTIPYFMGPDGGEITKNSIYVDHLPAEVTGVRIEQYRADELDRITQDRFANGFSVVILPATSDAHLRYAAEAPDYHGLFDQPVVGWVSGVHMDDLGMVHPKVYAGSAESGSKDTAVVLYAELPEGMIASVDIVNLFEQADGPTLTFDDTGFVQQTVNVDGVATDFAGYLREIDHDVRLPLVADYFGAMVNASIQDVPADGAVALYAPVFKGIDYKLAGPVGDYVSAFASHIPSDARPAYSCNCILNFLYSELEGKKTGAVVGPITFGEIAYQLLNQTLVYLTIHA